GLELVGAGDAETVHVPLEILLVHLHQMRRDFARLLLHLARRDHARGAGDRRRTRAVGAEPVRRGVGVALFHLNLLGRNAELARDDLRVGGFVSLPLRFGAEPRDDAAGRVHPQLAAVEHADAQDVAVLLRPGADDFREADDADPHQLAAAALLLLFFAQAGVVDRRERLLHRRRIVAAVVLP